MMNETPPTGLLEELVQSLGSMTVEEFVASLSPSERRSLIDSWDLWARPHQRLPPGKWRRWILRGGRGSGKSSAASNTIHTIARDKKRIGTGIIAIVGRTHTDVRLMNINDQATGILATAPAGFRPTWSTGPGILTWPNGVIGRVFAAEAPESIRGNNIAFLLADELQSWPNGEDTWWTIVEPAVRVGRAQMMITMTPKPLQWLRDLEAMAGSVRTGARMYDNPYLAQSVVKSFEHAYAGREAAKQEIDGEYIEHVQGALLSYLTIHRNRVEVAPKEFKQIVIAVDPASTNNDKSDETGVIVYGHTADDQGYTLDDESGKFGISDGEWAHHVVDVYRKWEADCVIVEANNGWDHIPAGIAAVDRSVPVHKVTATRDKMTRAEPVGTLFARGRIHHVGDPRKFARLDSELTTWIPGEGKSPNRLDAFVWAATWCHIAHTKPEPASCRGLLGRR